MSFKPVKSGNKKVTTKTGEGDNDNVNVVTYKLLGETREQQHDFLQKVWGEKFRPTQPENLTKFTLQDVDWKHVMKANKIDGEHQFVLLVDGSILECEQYKDRFYILDILRQGDVDVTSKHFSDRLTIMKSITLPPTFLLQTYELIQWKPSDVVRELQKLLQAPDIRNGIDTDGYIFVRTNQDYLSTITYKVKSKKHLTADFMMKWDVDSEKYMLYCGGDKRAFNKSMAEKHIPLIGQQHAMIFEFAIPYLVNKNFSWWVKPKRVDYEYMTEQYPTSITQKFFDDYIGGKLHNMIVECFYDDNMHVYPLRVRHDKIKPNAFLTCLSNYESRLLPIENVQGDGDQYFQIYESDPKYDMYRKFGRVARIEAFENTMKHCKNKNCILDVGAGRWSNQNLIIKHGFKMMLLLEPDRNSWVESYSRLMEINEEVNKGRQIPTTFLFDYASITLFKNQNIDVVMSNYAFHYLFLEKYLDNFNAILIALKDYTSKDCCISFVDYDGKSVFELLKKCGGHYKSDKYEAVADWITKDAELKGKGQEVQMSIPTISKNLSQECLFNFEYLSFGLKKLGFNVIEDKSCLRVVKGAKGLELDKDDEEFCGLQHVYLLQRGGM